MTILPELTGDSLSSHVLVLVSGSADGERDLGLEEEALFKKKKKKARTLTLVLHY